MRLNAPDLGTEGGPGGGQHGSMAEVENRWDTPEHVRAYLDVADTLPHRREGEAVLVELLPDRVGCLLDLGCGDGRTAAIVLAARPEATAVALDFSPPMLAAARARFAGDERVTVAEHDLERPLSDQPLADGPFDLVVSSFAIHHLDDAGKQRVHHEVAGRLAPGAPFLHLEHVASATPALHGEFLDALDIAPADEDPANQLVRADRYERWLAEAGLVDVDVLWRWREVALIHARKPS